MQIEAKHNAIMSQLELLVRLPKETLAHVEYDVLDLVTKGIAKEFLEKHKKELLDSISIADVKTIVTEKISKMIADSLVTHFNEAKIGEDLATKNQSE